MKRLQLLFLSSALLAATAAAEPVYLHCSMDMPNGKGSTYDVKLDEASGKITHTESDGSAFNADGFFSATEVAYKSVKQTDSMTTTDQYKINRVDLSVKALFTLKDPTIKADIANEAVGTCELVQAPKRQF